MELPTAPSQRKRVRFSYSDEDSDADEAPKAKKVRFPKGKKDSQREGEGSKGLGVVDGEEDDAVILSTDPRVAALERATRRDRISEQLLAEDPSLPVPDDVAVAEEDYEGEDDERLEDGTRIEPFNLKQEREEGYFDAEGNYVEYRNEDDTKDAWLDSVEGNTRFAGNGVAQPTEDSVEEEKELSEQEIAVLKRSIADSLQPGETVLRALRRLKDKAKEEGGRNGRMTGDTKVVFDQLTENAMKLLDNGDYNIYEEKKETLQREAEGYEALARMRAGVTNGAQTSTSGDGESDMFADDPDDMWKEPGLPSSKALGFSPGSQVKSNDNGLDMFGDGEENPKKKHENYRGEPPSAFQLESVGAIPVEGSGYVFDESSGYYYNHEVGYYYDVASGLYCSASTYQWYKFDKDQNAYLEVTQ